MTDKHKEIVFESEIVTYLIQYGWLEGQDNHYNKKLAIYPEDLVGFIQDTQPKALEKLSKFHNGDTEKVLCKRATEQMDKHGSLFVLRNGFKDRGVKFTLCQFKPEHGLNTETLDRYQKNRLRVVRQIHYSVHNKNCIDLVLFVNGIPVATLELKTDFTQSIHDAIKQYKYDRRPKDKITRKEEPLLTFKKRALVHFAVSTDEVYMTTHLQGKDTFFLPFNQGNDGGAGNPHNPNGYTTAYLWEKIFAKETWLKILGRFIHLQVTEKLNDKGLKVKKETLIFPRFHQLDVVGRLIDTVRIEGAGYNYLIQHSAGSGKSNSIAWLAHQLSSLHDDNDKKLFDTVIVITDRTVLDNQLQETIYQFEHKEGVVTRINRELSRSGSKSSQLADSLEQKSAIIIVTIQTFPFVLEEIQKRTSLKKRNFAVIADEAHSSQSGSTAKKLRQVLTQEQLDEGVELSADEVLAATISARTQLKNISYFAFTATPKAKTLEMFGRLPDPNQVASKTNTPQAFHVYTMQQAIQEGFILDILQNYITYDLAYKLAHTQPTQDEEVDSKKAKIQLAKWVRLHSYNISQKIEIIIEHFRLNIAHLLNGQAKAMVVTSSRKEAVRYKVAFDKYIKRNKYPNIHAMVAFSGKVSDPKSLPYLNITDDFTETNMNPGLKGRDMRKAFDTDEYQVMLVANKFQTGFDQPKLCAMYVDKKLSGVDAVQTLSRLNRTFSGKDKTFILDFVNDANEIKESFEPYYKEATLAGITDPNLIYDLQIKLDGNHIYTPDEVERFAKVFFDKKGTQAAMNSIIKPPTDRYRNRYRQSIESIQQASIELIKAKEQGDDSSIIDAEFDLKEAKKQKEGLELFKKDLGSFYRLYEFLSQIVDYEDEDLEKLSVFARHLLPNLKTISLEDPIDLSNVEMTHYRLTKQKEHLSVAEDTALYSVSGAGSGIAHDPETEKLSTIVQRMNDLFAGELTDNDLLNYANTIKDKIKENDTVMDQLHNNSKEQALLGDFKEVLNDAVINSLDISQDMATQVLSKENIRNGFAKLLLDMIYSELESRQG